MTDTEPEVQSALNEVRSSSAEFERAMDRLKNKIVSSTDQFADLRAKGVELIDAVKESKAAIEDYFVGKRQATESYLQSKRQETEAYFLQKRESVESYLTKMSGSLRDSASSGLDVFEKQPMAGWFVVFLSGYVLGNFLSQKKRASAKDLPIEAVHSEVPIEVPGKSTAA
jgi:hypothetical protein